MPGPPSYDSLEEERQSRKERLAASFRIFANLGFDEGQSAFRISFLAQGIQGSVRNPHISIFQPTFDTLLIPFLIDFQSRFE